MRYEKPEFVLIGQANAVVLGYDISLVPETEMSSFNPSTVGYDE